MTRTFGCPRWDSNPHCADFEAASSTNWDTRACQSTLKRVAYRFDSRHTRHAHRHGIPVGRAFCGVRTGRAPVCRPRLRPWPTSRRRRVRSTVARIAHPAPGDAAVRYAKAPTPQRDEGLYVPHISGQRLHDISRRHQRCARKWSRCGPAGDRPGRSSG